MHDIPVNEEREQLIAALGNNFSKLAAIGLNDLPEQRRLEVAKALETGAAELRFSVAMKPFFRVAAYLLTPGSPPHVLFQVGEAPELPTLN